MDHGGRGTKLAGLLVQVFLLRLHLKPRQFAIAWKLTVRSKNDGSMQVVFFLKFQCAIIGNFWKSVNVVSLKI